MKQALKWLLLIVMCSVAYNANAQKLRSEVFSLLNLDYPGLEKVKAYHLNGENEKAAQALLEYYRTRDEVHIPDFDLNHISLSDKEQKWADDALDHTFFVHRGYQPSFNYGKDINWQYWPVKDNELRWQLHRHKWFIPMGKAYRLSNKEIYAKEWVLQYVDWMVKNPLLEMTKKEFQAITDGELKGKFENMRFAWRPLEVSRRLQDQTMQFKLFLSSKHFTPNFLTQFLVNIDTHGEFVLNHYSDKGNHLLFEAQRMIYGGTFFPELKAAKAWRKSGIDILNREINVQVYNDGGQFELDPHYHLAAINIFCKALFMADINGFRNEFPTAYLTTVEKMIMFYLNLSYPDYTNPCFSDAKLVTKSAIIDNCKEWHQIFPNNKAILYFATDGKEGELPSYLSKGFTTSGFFVFRNSWKSDATQMIVKAGPQGFWHCQPDNGTFELWFNGKNLFPDSGSYVYAGEGEVMEWRNWFRQTAAHNTLTLDDKTIEVTESKTKLWKPEGDVQILVTENNSYQGFKHRRSIFFVDNTYFVIVDEAVGAAQGVANLYYQLPVGKINVNKKKMVLATKFSGESNMKIKCFGPQEMTLRELKGWTSPAYRQKTERLRVAFDAPKQSGEAVRYITIIYPLKDKKESPKLFAKFGNKDFNENKLKVNVRINGERKTLTYKIQ